MRTWGYHPGDGWFRWIVSDDVPRIDLVEDDNGIADSRVRPLVPG